MKTRDLTGPALDWAVALCEGLNVGVLTIGAQVKKHEDIMKQHYSDAEWEEHLKAWGKHVLPTIKPRLVAFDDEGFPVGFPLHYEGKGHRIAYSTDWAQGGPIIEREKLCLIIGHAGVWLAYSLQNYTDEPTFMVNGPTPLVAAMRAFVSSKLGDTVDVPAELIA